MCAESLKVGVLAASTKQLGELNRLIRGAGLSVAASAVLRDQLVADLPVVDVWVVNLDLHDEKCERAVDYLESLGVPVIFDEDVEITMSGTGTGSVDVQTPMMVTEMRLRKERRIAEKLRQLVRKSNVASFDDRRRRADEVWVLAASTGGPGAVSEFLRGVSADLSGVAFVYAQHTDVPALKSLRDVLTKHIRWNIELTEQPQVIREKTIYVLSPAFQVELSDGGTLSPLADAWSGCYKPSINQIIAKVARVYRQRCGVIVFSGMGDDGAQSCEMMHHRGGQVWIQSVESCAIDSMPASVAQRGLAGFSAPPSQLAKKFNELHGQA